MLNTTATLRCLIGGWWDPSPYDIGCIPVRCSRPESIDRGYVSGTNYNFGAVVAYSCDKGFLIRGEKRRTCKADGEWGGALPSCVPVTCPPHPTLKNGYIQVRHILLFPTQINSQNFVFLTLYYYFLFYFHVLTNLKREIIERKLR